MEKGIEIDEWRPATLATSMVDDVFFILQTCSQRGLATGNLQCSSAILGQVNAVLASSLRPALDSQWKVRHSSLKANESKLTHCRQEAFKNPLNSPEFVTKLFVHQWTGGGQNIAFPQKAVVILL